ncbi:MAG TPA: helix-turn-helix transcriptional regulator [Pseudolabrys sp.]|uniref:helix-turn-helix domain-containing protein n=1 Tax=Pseudolabrys sp. TaxID=1960880 RepID=UPI002DDC93D1|nr:helix-turn-helix transcriptional regulator [Pseudolabrys sp.]HEV2629015.1 helix-turn-helix transcriptional regulator [Pseudolabrys sp.]
MTKTDQMYARALKLIRQYHRLSQVELADKLKLSKSFISELEGGHKNASLDVLERYATFFRIPLSSLMLFAEKAETADFGERTRAFTADKIMKMLEWLQETSDNHALIKH